MIIYNSVLIFLVAFVNVLDSIVASELREYPMLMNFKNQFSTTRPHIDALGGRHVTFNDRRAIIIENSDIQLGERATSARNLFNTNQLVAYTSAHTNANAFIRVCIGRWTYRNL